MMAARHAGRLLVDLFLSAVRSGRWWAPALMVLLAVAATVIAATKIVVPTVTYVLF